MCWRGGTSLSSHWQCLSIQGIQLDLVCICICWTIFLQSSFDPIFYSHFNSSVTHFKHVMRKCEYAKKWKKKVEETIWQLLKLLFLYRSVIWHSVIVFGSYTAVLPTVWRTHIFSWWFLNESSFKSYIVKIAF